MGYVWDIVESWHYPGHMFSSHSDLVLGFSCKQQGGRQSCNACSEAAHMPVSASVEYVGKPVVA